LSIVNHYRALYFIHQKMQMKRIYTMATAFLLTGLLLGFDMPKGWLKAGSAPLEYQAVLDSTFRHEGKASASLRCTGSSTKGFGTLMQYVDAEHWRGKRLRMRGWLKTAGVTGWAGLWLRIDQSGVTNNRILDNMGNRPVKGDTDWARYDIVLDIPADGQLAAFGVMLVGGGQVWVDDIHFETVGMDVPVTLQPQAVPKSFSNTPKNLNFEQ
jgi:hypothetical protein